MPRHDHPLRSPQCSDFQIYLDLQKPTLGVWLSRIGSLLVKATSGLEARVWRQHWTSLIMLGICNTGTFLIDWPSVLDSDSTRENDACHLA